MENGERKRVLRPRRNSGANMNTESRSFNERRSFGDNERNSFDDRPRRSFNEGEGRSYSDRPKRNFGDSNSRSFGERRSYNDRPRRSFNEGEGRSYGDRPRRSFGDGEGRSYSDRPKRNFGDSNSRSFGERRSYGDRPRRSFNESEGRSYGERPRRSFGDGERRSFDERPRRQFGESEGRSYSDRPKRNFGDSSDRRGGFSRGGAKGGFKKPAKRNNEESGINRMIDRKPVFDPAILSDNDSIKIPVKDVVRLNKFIANSGVCSRREADSMIQAGVVTVNGEIVTELGTKVNIYTDEVKFNGETLRGEEKVYIIMNKPKGFVTTASDPHADKTVMDLLKGCNARVFPVGRLDKNTTGVLMFTNDGEIAEKLTHPSYDKKKIYQVNLDSDLKQEDFDKVLSGVVLTDGEIAADELEYIDDKDHRKVGIEIHSGKNRIVRRIFETLGYEVKALDRVYFAGLTKRGIKRGGWRYLSEGEVNILKMGAYR